MKLERNAHARRQGLGPWAMAGVLAAMWLVLAALPATGGRFLTQGNLASLLSQSAVLLVVSVGMTFAILIRGIDLSVGAGVALTGVVAGIVHVKCGLPAPVAMLAALAAGAAIGAWHGFWVGWLGVPAFVATLAVIVAVPLVFSVTCSCAVPPARFASPAVTPAASVVARWTRSVAATGFQLWSTAVTVTVNGVPAVCSPGVPVRPEGVPGAEVSPGSSAWSCAKAPAPTAKLPEVPAVLPAAACRVPLPALPV